MSKFMILTGKNGCVGVYQDSVLVSTHDVLDEGVMENILRRDPKAEVSDRACDCDSVGRFLPELKEDKPVKARVAKAKKKD